MGNKHNYHEVQATLDSTGIKPLALATFDQRPYIVSGKRTPDFVGLQRNGLIIGFDVLTESGNPLAADISKVVADSFRKSGIDVVLLATTQKNDRLTVVSNLRGMGKERLVLITLREWASDTYQNTSLYYDLTIEVFDKEAKSLATKAVSNQEDFGKKLAYLPTSNAKLEIPDAFKKVIESLLNSPEILAALR